MPNYQLVHLYFYSNKGFYATVDVEKFYLDMYDLKAHNPDVTVIFFHIFENLYARTQMILGIEALRPVLEHLNLKYYFVLDGNYNHQIINPKNITTLNWGMMFTWYQVKLKNHALSTRLNPTDGRGLFLCGKGDKEHRVGLLKKFYETGNLHNLSWSFNNSKQILQTIRERFFQDYSDAQFDTFVKECTRTLDYDPNYNSDDQIFSHFGFPFPASIYKETGFSIITETQAQQDTHLFTEKTWRAIVNKHPFIMMGPVKNIERLEELGFKTFTKYLKIPDYHTIHNLSDRMDAIVTNAVHLRTELEKKDVDFYRQLRYDTECNYSLFMELAQKDIEKFLSDVQGDMSLIESTVHFHNYIQAFKRK